MKGPLQRGLNVVQERVPTFPRRVTAQTGLEHGQRNSQHSQRVLGPVMGDTFPNHNNNS